SHREARVASDVIEAGLPRGGGEPRGGGGSPREGLTGGIALMDTGSATVRAAGTPVGCIGMGRMGSELQERVRPWSQIGNPGLISPLRVPKTGSGTGYQRAATFTFCWGES